MLPVRYVSEAGAHSTARLVVNLPGKATRNTELFEPITEEARSLAEVLVAAAMQEALSVQTVLEFSQ